MSQTRKTTYIHVKVIPLILEKKMAIEASYFDTNKSRRTYYNIILSSQSRRKVRKPTAPILASPGDALIILHIKV